MRRRFTAPIDELRCVWDITLRGDKSGARCMRRATIGGLCAQHSRMREVESAKFAECCGGNDDSPPSHCMDCEEQPQGKDSNER